MAKRKSRNPDHVRQNNRPSADNEAIANQLEALLTPAIDAQQAYYRQLGLGDRILSLPLMVAAVLTLLWREVPSVQELNRLLAREGFLWCPRTQVTQQALSQRFLTFPAQLLERVFKQLLPRLKTSWSKRTQRRLPESVNFALKHFESIWVADGSTLEALFRKLKSLQQAPIRQLAGKICTVIDVTTRLPVEVWFHTNPRASDTSFEADLASLATAKTLLLLDRGFYHFQFFFQLISQEVYFILRKPLPKLDLSPFPVSCFLLPHLAGAG
jgi:hypothetical protein